MFAHIFKFEVRRWFRSIAMYVYILVLFLVAFFTGLLIAGTWPGVSVNFGGEKIFANSPAIIDAMFAGINNYVGLIIIVAVIGNSVLKDFTANTSSLIFTTPVSKFNYLFGRFFASLFIVLIILAATGLGLMAAYATPWVSADRMEAFHLSYYITTYWQTVIPNALLDGAIFFAVSLIARDIFVIWLSLIVFFIAIGVSNSYFSSLEHETLSALIDPLGAHAKRALAKYWTTYQKNHFTYPMTGLFLMNRLLWMGISFIILGIGYSFFSFTATARRLFGSKVRLRESSVPVFKRSDLNMDALPKVKPVFSTGIYLKNLWGLSVNECRALLRNTYFRIILLFGMLLLFLVSIQLGKLYDTATYPVTYMVAEYFEGTFHIIIVVITFMFSGELVWKARDFRMSNILDALPVPNWVFYLSKLVGLMFMQVILLLLVMICGMIVQAFMGYTNFEPGVYLGFLFGFKLLDLWYLAVLAVLVQTLVSNKYVGYFILAIFYLWNSTFALLVLKHNLFIYMSDPGVEYSDMNGFGHAGYPYLVFKVYWGVLALCFAGLSSLLWARGSETGLKRRWRNARLKEMRGGWVVIVTALMFFIGCGAYVYYNTMVLNKDLSDFQQEELQAKYEQLYKKYQHAPQPKITSVKLNVDIYPRERNLYASGTLVLKNKTSQPIDSIHVLLNDDAKLREAKFSTGLRHTYYDSVVGYRIYTLAQALQPGDSLQFSFKTDLTSKGFKENFTGLGAPIYNGTFVNNTSFVPSIGYNRNIEIADNNKRKKHGLGYRPTENPITDTQAYQVNELASDADFIDFDATVSTVPDQIAIAPGYLQKEWTTNGRHYFHYKMDSPILNFYSFLSARYKVKKEMWHDVSLEIYYQEGHEYNLERMFQGMKKALDYYSVNFSPYQHRQVRILEFPRYSTFAQSFPNTIPFSEGIGFIAKVDDSSKEDINYPLYITAHEVAHQWWAHQVIGADVEGSVILVETMAQYGAIMVMQKDYTPEKLHKFLHYEMDRYLSARSNEGEKEKPLAYIDQAQSYIRYEKGGIEMYALSHYIGEDSLNHALQRFLKQYAFKGAPYPTSLDLIRYIKQVTPDSMQYFVKDVFENITLYNNKLSDAAVTETPGGQYTINFSVASQKLYADSSGYEKAVPSNDYIEVGVYNEKRKLIGLQRYKLPGGTSRLSIVVAEKPAKIVVDPNLLLIDKDLNDNEKRLTVSAPHAKK
ncbi:MAG: hypothetical protein JSS82_13590 [Bacteroidetes bacterium]|nr:hypothetical protein [Bacteroidota bacterium]